MDVSPTKGTLLRLQDELEEIEDGRDLLDKKREVLIQRLMELIEQTEGLQKQIRVNVQEARSRLIEAQMRMGNNRVRSRTYFVSSVDVTIDHKSVMGVDVPRVHLSVETPRVPYGLGESSVSLDKARDRWLEVLRSCGELAESQTAVWRIAEELRKTQRRVKALESIVIKRYKATIDFIEQTLEEESREDVVRAKKVKRKSRRESRQ